MYRLHPESVWCFVVILVCPASYTYYSSYYYDDGVAIHAASRRRLLVRADLMPPALASWVNRVVFWLPYNFNPRRDKKQLQAEIIMVL